MVLRIYEEATFCCTNVLQVKGVSGPYETWLALELLCWGRIRAETIITHRFGLNDAAQAFNMVAHPGNALKVVIFSDEESF